MVPTSFEESNRVLSAPEGMDNCDPLSVYCDPEQAFIVSCFKVTKEELAEINRTGRVWLIIHGYNMPPVSLIGIKPFKS